MHMTSDSRQGFAWRNFLFWFYFIFICMLSAIIGYLTGLSIFWNVVDELCEDPQIKDELSSSECNDFVRGSILVFVTVGFIVNLYFSIKLKEWANVKRDGYESL